MKDDFLLTELHIENRTIAAKRVMITGEETAVPEACSLSALTRVFNGETIVMTENNTKCSGLNTGSGLSDDLPGIPGGFGHFIAKGRGQGYPAGERIKMTPELGEAMMKTQPRDVMDGYNGIRLTPFEEEAEPDLVIILATPDQLAALVHVFNYRNTAYDNVIAPMVSGCASLLRIPFAEMKKGDKARAVIGNIDVFSRVHFPEDSFFFTVPGKIFTQMMADARESVFASPIWKGVRRRIHKDD